MVASTPPTVRAPVPRRSPWTIAAPALVVAVTGAMLLISAGGALRPSTPVQVRQVIFDRGETERSPSPGTQAQPPRRAAEAVQAPGWIEPLPYTIACSALTDGVVAEVLALEGERVELGQVVARLVGDDAEIEARLAAAEMVAAVGALRAAEAVREAAQADWDAPIERHRATATWDAQARETQAELAQLPALIDAETALLEQIRAQLEWARQALEAGGANQVEVVTLQKRAEAQAATLEATRARAAILEARLDRQHAELGAAERAAMLRIPERAALDIALAGVERARAESDAARARHDAAALRVRRVEVRAPISGVVLRRLVAPGDKVMLGMDDPRSAHVVHLYDPSSLQVRVDVPLSEAAAVFEGQHCEITAEILPDVVFRGLVIRIAHEADIQKNTLQIKVRIIDPDALLRPEMLARVRFLPGISQRGTPDIRSGGGGGDPHAGQTVLVPAEALDETGPEVLVWVVRDRRSGRGVAQPERIALLGGQTPADLGAEWRRVAGNLNPGDLLVAGPTGLRPGQAVRVVREDLPAREGARP